MQSISFVTLFESSRFLFSVWNPLGLISMKKLQTLWSACVVLWGISEHKLLYSIFTYSAFCTETLLLHYWCCGPSQFTLLHCLLDVCITVILLHRKEVLVIHRQLCVGWVGLLRYMFPLVCLWCYKITHFTWSWVHPSKDTLKRLVFHWCLLTDSCFQGVFWWSDSALVNMDSDGALRLQGGKQTTSFDSLFFGNTDTGSFRSTARSRNFAEKDFAHFRTFAGKCFFNFLTLNWTYFLSYQADCGIE